MVPTKSCDQEAFCPADHLPLQSASPLSVIIEPITWDIQSQTLTTQSGEKYFIYHFI